MQFHPSWGNSRFFSVFTILSRVKNLMQEPILGTLPARVESIKYSNMGLWSTSAYVRLFFNQVLKNNERNPGLTR